MKDDTIIQNSSGKENDIKKEISVNDDEAILKNNENENQKESQEDSDELKNQNKKIPLHPNGGEIVNG